MERFVSTAHANKLLETEKLKTEGRTKHHKKDFQSSKDSHSSSTPTSSDRPPSPAASIFSSIASIFKGSTAGQSTAQQSTADSKRSHRKRSFSSTVDVPSVAADDFTTEPDTEKQPPLVVRLLFKYGIYLVLVVFIILLMGSFIVIGILQITVSRHQDEIDLLKKEMKGSKTQSPPDEVDSTKAGDISAIANQIAALQNDASENKKEMTKISKSIKTLMEKEKSAVMFTATISNALLTVQPNTIVEFDHVVASYGKNYDENTGVFNCEIPGYYMAYVSVSSALPVHVSLAFKKNEDIINVRTFADFGSGSDPKKFSSSQTVALLLHTGDRVSVVAQDHSTLRGSHYSSFSMFLITAF